MEGRLLLLLTIQAASALMVTDPSQLPSFPYSSCASPPSAQSHPYNVFVSSIKSNLTFEQSTGWSFIAYEQCDPQNQDTHPCSSNYKMEAVRTYASTCTTCPYHVDGYWVANPPATTTGQFNNLFGPCFDGAHSMQTVCLQHPALAPTGFTGTYHYPMQMPFTDAMWLNSTFAAPLGESKPMHFYLSSGTSSSPVNSRGEALPPSTYGLGKQAVQTWLGSVQLINRSSFPL